MKILIRAYLCVAYYFAITVFILVSLFMSLACLVLGWLPGSKILKRPLRSMLQFLFRRWAWFMGFIRVLNLRTPEKTRRKSEGGEIWVMNHPSLLDGSYLLKFITNGTCIFKQQIASNPLYGGTARLAGHIPNVGGPDMVRMACEALARGEDLVIFPEGTRSTHVNVDNFKPGFALIAKRSNAAINVVWMAGPDDFMTREAPFWKVPELTAIVTMDKVAKLEPKDHKTVGSLLEAVKAIYREKGRSKC